MRKIHFFLVIIFVLSAKFGMAQKKQTLFFRAELMSLLPNDENLEVLYKNGYGLQAGIGKKWHKTSVSLSVGVHTYASKQGTITINPTTYGKFSGLLLVPVQLNVEQAIIGPWFVGGSFGGVYQKSSIDGMLNGVDVSQQVSSGTAIWEYGTGFQINCVLAVTIQVLTINRKMVQLLKAGFLL
jgi:hypothetical protein